MEAAGYSDMLVPYITIWHHNPEDLHLHYLAELTIETNTLQWI